MAAEDPELHAGLLALLGAVVTASVFTLGFVSHRVHMALIQARAELHEDREGNADHAIETLAGAQSLPTLIGNGVVALIAFVAVVVLALGDDLAAEDCVTVAGFALVEVAIVALGFADHAQVRRRLKASLPSDHPAR